VSCSDALGEGYYGPAPDPGEAASGGYGEISVTYSSTPYMGPSYGSYAGLNGSSFNTHTKELSANNNTASASATPPAATAPTSSAEAYVFSEPAEPEKDVLLNYTVPNEEQSLVYYHNIMLDWRTFVSSFPQNIPMFWVKTQGGWQCYSMCPLGGWLKEIMFIPDSGRLRMYETYPNQTVFYYDFGYATPGYHYIWFNGDTPGRHVQMITVDHMPSNVLIFDVSSSSEEVDTTSSMTEEPNDPAKAFCIQRGNLYDNGICTFPGGSSCDAWDFYRGDCILVGKRR
jgi:hypothetical protein